MYIYVYMRGREQKDPFEVELSLVKFRNGSTWKPVL